MYSHPKAIQSPAGLRQTERMDWSEMEREWTSDASGDNSWIRKTPLEKPVTKILVAAL